MDYKFYSHPYWFSYIKVTIKVKIYGKSSLPFAIVGLGKTGLSIARYLNKNKIDFIAYDTRENLEITNEINSEIKNDKIILGSFKEKYIDHHNNFILSPGLF